MRILAFGCIAISLAAIEAVHADDDDAKAWRGTRAIVTTRSAVKMTIRDGSEIDVVFPIVSSWQAVGNHVFVSTFSGQSGYVDKEKLVSMRDAVEVFSDRIKNDPNDADGYFRRGLAYEANRDFKAAIKDLDEAIRRDAKTAEYFIGRGLVRHELADLDGAGKDFTEAIRLDPKSAIAWHFRGKVRWSRNSPKEAVADESEALHLLPSLVSALSGRAGIYEAMRDYDKCIEDCSALISLDPDSPRFYLPRSRARAQKHDLDGALKDNNRAIELDPKNAGAYLQRGNLYYGEKKYANAVEDYAETVRLDPKMAIALNNLAWILATAPDDKIRDGKRALELSKSAGEIDGWTNWSYLGTHAAACAEIGQFDEAIRCQGKAVAAAPAAQKKDAQSCLDLYRSHKPKRD